MVNVYGHIMAVEAMPAKSKTHYIKERSIIMAFSYRPNSLWHAFLCD